HLAFGRRPGEAHQPGIVAGGADQRQRRLDQRQKEGQHQSEMAELGDHGVAPSCQRPAFFRASTTSRGMYFSSCLASTSSARKPPSGPSRPSATTPWPSRNRSGSTPL